MQKYERETERTVPYSSLFVSAFDLSSGGMGIHSAAVELFVKGEDLPDWARNSVSISGSNYLVNPYIFAWRDATSFPSAAPKSLSPHSDAHLLLLDKVSSEYHGIENRQKRLFFGGEKALEISSNPVAPITREEFWEYLKLAKDRGVVDYPDYLKDAKKQGAIESSAYIPPILSSDVDPNNNIIGLCMSLIRNGVSVNEEKLEQYGKIIFDSRFREDMVRAAIYKLGAMLAATDQITYEAFQQGVPVSAAYQPEDPTGKWHANWERLFGRKMPTLRQLYQQVHRTFTMVADESDPLVAYLFPLADLPQLAA